MYSQIWLDKNKTSISVGLKWEIIVFGIAFVRNQLSDSSSIYSERLKTEVCGISKPWLFKFNHSKRGGADKRVLISMANLFSQLKTTRWRVIIPSHVFSLWILQRAISKLLWSLAGPASRIPAGTGNWRKFWRTWSNLALLAAHFLMVTVLRRCHSWYLAEDGDNNNFAIKVLSPGLENNIFVFEFIFYTLNKTPTRWISHDASMVCISHSLTTCTRVIIELPRKTRKGHRNPTLFTNLQNFIKEGALMKFINAWNLQNANTGR